MGCLQGKEQEEIFGITQTQVGKDPWWCMLKKSDLSFAYMRDLEERIRIVERNNRINEEKIVKQKEKIKDQDVKNRQNQKDIRILKQKNKDQDDRNRRDEQRNRHQEEFNRNQQRINMEQENKNTIQEEMNRHQEKINKELEQQNMVQEYIKNENKARSEDKTKAKQKQEGNKTLMTQDSYTIVIKDDMAKKILVEKQYLKTAVDIIIYYQQDISKIIEIFGFHK